MRAKSLPGWNKSRLRLVLLLFFMALAIPTGLLIMQAGSQMKWEAFHQQRLLAEELHARIDRRYMKLIEVESARSFTDYSFLNVAGENNNGFLKRSPLSAYPVKSGMPGVIGYFQIDHNDLFSTPLLPENRQSGNFLQLSSVEVKNREQLVQQIYQTLNKNKLVASKPLLAVKQNKLKDGVVGGKREDDVSGIMSSMSSAPSPSMEAPKQSKKEVRSQLAFDQLGSSDSSAYRQQKVIPGSLGRVEDLKLKNKYQKKLESQKRRLTESKAKASKVLRKERNVLPVAEMEESLALEKRDSDKKDLRVSIFESEIDAFNFSVLDSGQFVLFRKVWKNGQRYIQGILIDSQQFIDKVIRESFYATGVSLGSDLTIAYQGNVLSVLGSASSGRYIASNPELQGTLLLQSNLSSVLGQLELIFSVNTLPIGPGGVVLGWLVVVLAVVFLTAFYLMYRLGLKQIMLSRQQQDFVSAVSHELKTPLTSIRMYGEMLREGWATEDKRKSYYDFIFTESERLSRLINNVLQLARMTRNDLSVELSPCSVERLLNIIESKISSQVEQADFTVNIECDDNIRDRAVDIDEDNFSQIMINLVDNALKFSAAAEKKQIDIKASRAKADTIQFSVRDYGPGIARDQMKKIFQLFYRSENEQTRVTVGTGIGLALVNQLAQTMNGKVDVVNQSPGAEFIVSFPIRADAR